MPKTCCSGTPTEDPFCCAKPEYTDKDLVAASGGGDELPYIIRRLAEIKDELDSRGIDPLVKEQDDLKKKLKKIMITREVDSAYDETSNFEAVLIGRSSEKWDVGNFKKAVPGKKHARYIQVVESLDMAAVKEGLHNGDLTRARLEKWNAVKKMPTSVALYVRERKQDDE